MPTIRQVAEVCGVSPMTVSFVLNNKRGQVSPETRDRVLKAIREMGYRPRTTKPAAERGRTNTLGIVTGVAGNSFMVPGYYNAILSGILGCSDRLDQNITIFTNSLFHTDTYQSIRIYSDGRCDGLLVIAPDIGSPIVAALQERGVPFFLIGDTGDSEAVSCVDLDNAAAAAQATDYLLAHGHRRIAFLGGPDFVRSTAQRRAGFLQVMAAQGISPEPAFVGINIHRDADMAAWTTELMRRPPEMRPTAFFGWNDGAASAVIRTVTTLGFSPPRDVSVIGIDDDPGSCQTSPPLTTLRQPYLDIGRVAIESLLARILGTSSGAQRILLPAELVVRESVAPPPFSLSSS